MDKTPMTAAGAEKLRAELNELKSVARPRVIKAIAEAREHGDLKENAEYHAAREQQGFIEGRIQEIEAKLSHAQIIEPAKLDAGGKVVFGATVELFDVEKEEEITYQIVGEDEAQAREHEHQANDWLSQRGVDAQLRRLESADSSELALMIQARDDCMLVLPGESTLLQDKPLSEALGDFKCPVLVVR